MRTHSTFVTASCALLALSLSACGSRSIENDTTPTAGNINDTGILLCSPADTTQPAGPCPQQGAPKQDAENGRDALFAAGRLKKIGAGAAGFDFTKLDATGTPLNSQDVDWSDPDGTEAAGSRWSCVQDHVTGLMWEVKESREDHPRYGGHTYTWYEESPLLNGGNAGTENNGTCTTQQCDTQGYRTWLNQQTLCGFNDWRMPTASELVSIAHTTQTSTAIDAHFFPNALKPRFYTRNSHAKDPSLAWYVYFSDASMSFTNKFDPSHLRLVRGGN